MYYFEYNLLNANAYSKAGNCIALCQNAPIIFVLIGLG